MSHFETTVCSRCGGSGHYSFSLIHGTMCYGCNGSGVKFTKRGKAATEYFQNLMMVPVEELKVGNAIRFFSQDRKFKEIVAIDEGTDAELGESTVLGIVLEQMETGKWFTLKPSLEINLKSIQVL